MRLYCSIEGLEANWVELPDFLTRAQMREWPTVDDDMLAVLPELLTACHLEVVGKVIDSPKEITADALDSVDIALYGFVVSSPYRAFALRKSLGNQSARPLSSSAGGKN